MLTARFLGRVDKAWPARHVALEIDGYRYHSNARTFVHDRERGNRIVAAGWALLRTTPASLRDAPHQVISDVKAALAGSSAA
jgi:very-short-patch-repair endonuclease